MKLVVDASVAALWFIEEPLSDRAAELPTRHDLAAPDFMAVEVANVLWKRLQRDPVAHPDDTVVCSPPSGTFPYSGWRRCH